MNASPSKRQIYVALVPEWLETALLRVGASIEDTMDFAKLASTVSVDDVCFYYAYTLKLAEYVGPYFDDMLRVYDLPANVAWLNENQNAVVNQLAQFNHAFNMNTDKLASSEVPVCIRQTNYRSEPAGSNGLLIVGQGTYDQFSSGAFAEDCVKTLNQLLVYSDHKRFDIFKLFTQTAH